MVKHIFSLAIAFAGASLLFLTTMVLITPNSQIHYQRLIASFLGVPELCLVRKMERRLPLTRSATIPARVWQLEPDENVTVTVNNAMQSWDDVNGESIQVVRHDRIAGQALLSDLYGSKMRWDLGFLAWSTPQLESLWSLTALYSRGGIFAASNIQCRVPVSHWFRKDSRESSQKGMLGAGENLDNENDDVHSAALDFGRISWRDCSLVVALDDANPSLFNDQIFASTSGHPILLKAIEKMVKTLLRQNTLLGRALRFSPLQAHPQAPTKHVSGSTVLTDAIRSALQLSKSVDAIDIMNLILIDDEVHTRARNLRLCFMNSRLLSEVVQSKVS